MKRDFIDIVISAPTRAALRTFLRDRGLVGPENENKRNVDITRFPDQDRIVRREATYDSDGNELTARAYFPGVAVVIRLSRPDEWDDENYDPETEPRVMRSRLIRWIRDNATKGDFSVPGTQLRADYWEMNDASGVRFIRHRQLARLQRDAGIAPHIWSGSSIE